MKFQANVPFKLTKMFYEKLGEQPVNKRVLVIRDLFTAMHASIDNAVTFITDDKEAYEVFSKNVVSNDEFGNNDTALLVDTEINKNAWKDFIKEVASMPKFDVAIMNPPYDGNLHLKILEKVIPVADKVVNISPVRWLQDPLAKYKKNSDYNKFENSISKKIENLDVIDVELSNNLFQIYFGALGIYTIGKGGYDYSYAQRNSLVHKFISKSNVTFMDVATEEGYRGKYKSNYFGIINSHYGDTSAWISNNFELFTSKRETNTNKVIFFNSTAEVTNCFQFLNLKVMRYFAKLIRFNQRVPWQFVPYLDYTQPWDNKRFCAYFGITGYIDDDHAVPNSEWEIILNTIK